MKSKNGNITIIAMIFTSGVLIIMMFVLAIFRSNVNGLLYGVKTDMYVANKTAVASVNKNQANIDNFKYDEIDIKKLQKILGIYEDCEKVCEKAVDELPIALFRDTTSFGGVLSGSGDVPKSSISGKFYSHSIINDDWLNELIF